MERHGTKAVPRWRPPRRQMVFLIVAASAAPFTAGFSECVEECVKTPTPQGHFHCCTNPLVSSFNKPSCATGCHMAEYSQNLAECNSWCEKASADDGCTFQVPGVSGKDGSISMCGNCDCGLHDCPGHAPPEPEQCKDPAHGGPEGGDCGWVNRCRGSLEGCKLGCKLQQSAGRSGWGFLLVLCFSAAGYVGIGIGLRVKRNGAPTALASHPHFRQWQEFGGLVVDGVRMTQAKLTGKPMPRPSRGGGGAGGAGYSALSAGSSSPPSSRKSKPKDDKKKSKKKNQSSDAAETTAAAASHPVDDTEIAAQASILSGGSTTPTGSPAAKDTASAGGGRWVHVPG